MSPRIGALIPPAVESCHTSSPTVVTRVKIIRLRSIIGEAEPETLVFFPCAILEACVTDSRVEIPHHFRSGVDRSEIVNFTDQFLWQTLGAASFEHVKCIF